MIEVILGTCFSVVIVLEILLRLNFIECSIRLILIIQKALKIIVADRISDCWKEKALLYYSKLMLTNSIKLFFLLFVSISPIILISFLGGDYEKKLLLFMLTPYGIFVSIFVSFMHLAVRKYIKQ
jgi:hypothetical protein